MQHALSLGCKGAANGYMFPGWSFAEGFELEIDHDLRWFTPWTNGVSYDVPLFWHFKDNEKRGFSWSADVLSRKVLHLFQKMGQLLVCMGWKPAYVHSWRGGSWFVQVSLVVWSLSRKNTVIYGETRETVVLNWSQHSFPAILHHDSRRIFQYILSILLHFT